MEVCFLFAVVGGSQKGRGAPCMHTCALCMYFSGVPMFCVLRATYNFVWGVCLNHDTARLYLATVFHKAAGGLRIELHGIGDVLVAFTLC